MGTKKGQRRKTARRAYSGWVVTALFKRGGKRLRYRNFKTKAQARAYARKMAKSRKGEGSNPRVRKVR